MNSLILTQAKVLDFISAWRKLNLLTESEYSSIKRNTLILLKPESNLFF